jgi:hypothetical protein
MWIQIAMKKAEYQVLRLMQHARQAEATVRHSHPGAKKSEQNTNHRGTENVQKPRVIAKMGTSIFFIANL